MKDLDRQLRREMKEDTPTFERIRFFVTAPGEDGEPWLRLPRTFFLEDLQEYFQTDVQPRHNRLLSRACWQVALKKAPQGGLHGGKAGEGTEASESRKTGKADPSSKPLMGPPLTMKEAARALDHRPKEKKGAKYLCWDHMSHRGCNKPQACPHSHGPAPKWESLDWSVQLQLLRRGGFRTKARITEGQASEQMEAIRKAQAAKSQEMAEEGKKVKKVGEPSQEAGKTDSKVGKETEREEREPQNPESMEPPKEFTYIYPTDQEAEMVALRQGPDFEFYRDHDAHKSTKEACGDLQKMGDEVQERAAMIETLTNGHDGLLRTYLNNQLLLKKEAHPDVALRTEDVREILERAGAQGCPELSTAADEALQGATSLKTGYTANRGHLSKLTWEHGVGHGTLTWEGGTWEVFDFGDKLWPKGGWEKDLLSGQNQEGRPEIRQCLLLHCAAGYLERKNGKTPNLEEVQAQANVLCKELIAQASEASRQLGNCPESIADLRVFVHDLLHWGHDKDYRTVASFPAASLLEYTLHIVRMASDHDLSTEVIVGALSAGKNSQQIHLLVHQGHMRLLVPRDLDRTPPVIREVIAAGWECHLEAAGSSETTVRARDYLLCPRCKEPVDVPRRAGLRPPSVLGLHLRTDESGKIGGWTPGHLETQELAPTLWTDDDLEGLVRRSSTGFLTKP